MKRLIIMLLVTVSLVGCAHKNSSIVLEDTTGFIQVEEVEYNTDEINSNLTIEVILELKGACIIKLTNDSNNCYDEVHYSMGNKEGSFTHVAMYSECYDYLLVEKADITLLDTKLSDHRILDASNYIDFVQFYRLDNHSYGHYNYRTILNYNTLADYIVLYNHYYISESKDVYIEAGSEDQYIDEEYFLEMELVDGQVVIQNPNQYLTYHFGQVELFPRYFVVEEN